MLQKILIKKNYLLAVAAVVLLLLSYRLAFKKTMEAWQTNNRLKGQLAQSTDVSYQPQYIYRKNLNLDKTLDLYKADTANFRSNILSTISVIAEKENVKLSEVPTQDPIYHGSQFTIQKLSFEGNYFALIKVLNQLQNTKEIGVIRSTSLRSVVIPLNAQRAKKMVLEVFLEMIKS